MSSLSSDEAYVAVNPDTSDFLSGMSAEEVQALRARHEKIQAEVNHICGVASSGMLSKTMARYIIFSRKDLVTYLLALNTMGRVITRVNTVSQWYVAYGAGSFSAFCYSIDVDTGRTRLFEAHKATSLPLGFRVKD